VTIKRLESIILDEIINLRSKDQIHFYSDSKFEYEPDAGTFEKKGRYLKVDDRIFDAGQGLAVMEVKGFVYTSRVTVGQLVVWSDYDIVLPREKQPRKFRLVLMDSGYDWYQFVAHDAGVKEVTGSFGKLPPVYLSGKGRVDPSGIIVEINGSKRELPFDAVKEKTFRLDFSATHVIIASG
jgi:hypothetical protein